MDSNSSDVIHTSISLLIICLSISTFMPLFCAINNSFDLHIQFIGVAIGTFVAINVLLYLNNPQNEIYY